MYIIYSSVVPYYLLCLPPSSIPSHPPTCSRPEVDSRRWAVTGWCTRWRVSCRSAQSLQRGSGYRRVGGKGVVLIGSPRRMRGILYALLPTYLDRLIQRPLDRTPSYAPGARYQVGGENHFVPVLSFDCSSLWPGGPRMPADDQVFYGTSGSSLSEGFVFPTEYTHPCIFVII